MTCEEAESLILWYPGEGLSTMERSGLVAHTMACESCRAALVATVALASRLRTAVSSIQAAPYRAMPVSCEDAEGGSASRDLRIAQAILAAIIPPLGALLREAMVPPSARLLGIRNLFRWGGVSVV